jgi:predicted nuclease of predicted toxin-antitoxin system
VKFLLDHQLSPRLKPFFIEKGFEASHVSELGLHTFTDRALWAHAKSNAMQIVSKDEDFFYLASQDPAGPRLIWVRLGNCSSAALLQAFDRLWPQIERWMATDDRIVEIR